MPASSEQLSHTSSQRPDDATRLGSTQTQERNLILRALPLDEYARLLPHLEPCRIEVLQILVDAAEPVHHVYFPENAIASAARRTGEAGLIEAGTVGREGMAGLAVILGESWSPAVWCRVSSGRKSSGVIAINVAVERRYPAGRRVAVADNVADNCR
jgi:hypothetical protein